MGALRPKDQDADYWISGQVQKLHLSGETPYAEVAVQGDSPCQFNREHPESIEIKYLVPSTNFLLKSGPRFQYFGNARGLDTEKYLWADRVVDSSGASFCLQAKDTIRWTALDYLILGFAKVNGEMAVIMFLEPHTNDSLENHRDLFNRVCFSTINYFLSNFPIKRTGSTKMIRGFCPFYSLPKETQQQLDPVFFHLSCLAYDWGKTGAKFKPFSAFSKMKSVPKVTSIGSERINAHFRVFGDALDKDLDLDPVTPTPSTTRSKGSASVLSMTTQVKTTSKMAKTSKTQTKIDSTPRTQTPQMKRKATNSPSKGGKKFKTFTSDRNSDSFDDLEVASDDEEIHVRTSKPSPKYVTQSQTPTSKSSPTFKPDIQADRTASLEAELKNLRQQHLNSVQKENESLRGQLRASELEVNQLSTQLKSVQDEKEKMQERFRITFVEMETAVTRLRECEQLLQETQTKLKQTFDELVNHKKLLNDIRGQRTDMEEVRNTVRSSVEAGFDTRQSVVVEELAKFRATTSEDITKLRSEINSLALLVSVSCNGCLSL